MVIREEIISLTFLDLIPVILAMSLALIADSAPLCKRETTSFSFLGWF